MAKCEKFQDLVLGSLERGFTWYGRQVAKYPAVFIVLALILTGICSTGFINWKTEDDGLKLWLPQDSDFVTNTDWLRKTFPSKTRYSSILLLSDENVLTANRVNQMYRLLKEIQNIKNGSDSTSLWSTKCQRTPRQACIEMSILELYYLTEQNKYDDETIIALTDEDIIDKINANNTKSGITGGPFLPESYLGSITRDNNGRIVGAKAMLINFIGVNEGDQKGDDVSRLFEEKLLNLVNEDFNFEFGVVAYPLTMRSFGDLIGGSIGDDLNTLATGYILILLYVCFNLGKLNSVEHRVWLSLIGIVSVVLGVVSSYGLSQLMGFMFTQMNSLLPFLMLGVGIDDMFVIMQAWENLSEEERCLERVVRFGLAMKHAGVAITITSVTDLLAFLIGASTVIPALGSFCVYAGLGIFFIYIYQTTFFLAWFSLDQRRLEDTRDGCICCWKKKPDWQPSACSQKSLFQVMFQKIASLLLMLPAKIVVLMVTFALLGLGIYGTLTLEVNFDYNEWIETGTYLRNYLEEKKIHFPNGGQSSSLYFTDLNYAKDMESIGKLIDELVELSDEDDQNISPNSVKSWFPGFVQFVNTKRSAEFGADKLPQNKDYTDAQFSDDLFDFLKTTGIMFRQSFKFETEIDFASTGPAPKVLLSSVTYEHIIYEKTQDAIIAMKDVFSAVEKYSFSSNVFATNEGYGNYVTIDIITTELIRNVLMALGVVFICTLVLIADIATSLIVLFTVLFTIINVAGFACFWGLSIDTTFAIFVTISIGLCVDYSAHIAHGFMVEDGSRNERMEKTLVKIGPAVLNGGISTFVAFMLLSTSKSKVFFTFFQIFFLVVVFGLYHGLIFLPVVLGLIGPKSHGHHSENLVVSDSWAEKAKEAQANGGFVADDDLEETDSSPVSGSKNSISPPPTRPQTSTLPGSPEDQ